MIKCVTVYSSHCSTREMLLKVRLYLLSPSGLVMLLNIIRNVTGCSLPSTEVPYKPTAVNRGPSTVADKLLPWSSFISKTCILKQSKTHNCAVSFFHVILPSLTSKITIHHIQWCQLFAYLCYLDWFSAHVLFILWCLCFQLLITRERVGGHVPPKYFFAFTLHLQKIDLCL